MNGLLTATEMQAIEQVAIESGAVTGLELMERAGRGVIETIFDVWPDLACAPRRAVVLCGPGNNGGDGFVVARLLSGWGWEVEVFLHGDPSRLPPDARTNYDRWRAMGEVVDMRLASHPPLNVDLVVDALFGTGLTRPLEEATLEFVSSMVRNPQSRARIVAVDLPSGVCSDSGRELGEVTRAVTADLTVTFHAPKVGHHLGSGPYRSGRTVVVDIGLRAHASGAGVTLLGTPSANRLAKVDRAHKYLSGHALLLTGEAGHTGAARLAARGALRIGAGLVTLGAPRSAQDEVANQITALMLRRIEDAVDLAEAMTDIRITALCLGPGLGPERARALLPVALRKAAKATRSVVLDADALTAFADDPQALFGLLHERCVLTPHAGEFARLFPDIAKRLDAPATRGPACSKVDATREAARRAGCVILFKGPDTVIAAPDGRCSINAAHHERAAPWLATAGSGDVLAGFITGLLARGLAPMESAEAAAWLHVECARSFGPGLVAEDLPEELPRVLRALGV